MKRKEMPGHHNVYLVSIIEIVKSCCSQKLSASSIVEGEYAIAEASSHQAKRKKSPKRVNEAAILIRIR